MSPSTLGPLGRRPGRAVRATPNAIPAANTNRAVLIVAWAATLLASGLPILVQRELLRGDGALALRLSAGGLLIALAAALLWRAARPLAGYFGLLLAVLLAIHVAQPWALNSAVWGRLFGAEGAAWAWRGLGEQVVRLLPVLAAWLVLLLLGLRRRDFFLVTGQMDAAAAPVRWLDIKAGDRWTKTGRNFAVTFAAVTLIIAVVNSRGTLANLPAALPLLPAALLFAAMNAFAENFVFRAGPLALLTPVVGKAQALLLAAVFFGVGHYGSFPPGVLGVLLAGFLGWALGKSMLETRGFAWAWLIQVPMDAVVFSLFALAAAG